MNECVNRITEKFASRYMNEPLLTKRKDVLFYLKQVAQILNKKAHVLIALHHMYTLLGYLQNRILSQWTKKKNKDDEQMRELAKQMMDLNINDDDDDDSVHMDVRQVTTKPNAKKKVYTSAFMSQQDRTHNKRILRKFEIVKRKIWFFLVWCHDVVTPKDLDLWKTQLDTVIHIHSLDCDQQDASAIHDREVRWTNIVSQTHNHKEPDSISIPMIEELS
ncbi:hypothetical protein RFI_15606 [Reticulomyxa filosa]|uniref:Uncharacterized protein n=1 Tax=Reticulomyxa filosa TaxID=46433 RepID=X6N8G4_RETFI|nr:hypothetical protein RFI_15606 [Reticulomyxa filosa]|eukprot:ETO21597.1 hypothetical protein RFI_15606 [Reticulomyxa filosa]